MEPLRKRIIDNKLFIATKKVRLGGEIFQEYSAEDFTNPDLRYAHVDKDGAEGGIVRDNKTFNALLKKFALKAEHSDILTGGKRNEK